MIDSDSHVLPVVDGQQMNGVVTADNLLREVQSYLDAATVEDAYTQELVTVGPRTEFGKALHLLREHRITHLIVVDDDAAIRILSLYDVTDIASRSIKRSQGGEPTGLIHMVARDQAPVIGLTAVSVPARGNLHGFSICQCRT